MKKQAFFATAGLAATALIFSAFFWAGTEWADNIAWNTSGNCGSGCNTLSASNIPDNAHNGTNQPYRRVWYYGNGTYTADYYTVPANQMGSFSTTYTHSVGTPNVWLEITPTYDDRDKPKNKNFSVGGSNNYPADPIDYTKTVSLFQPLVARQGDTVTYVLNYGNPCESAISGAVKLSFPPSKTQIVDVQTFYNETGLNISGANSSGTLELSYSGLAQGKSRNVFVRFAFLENVNSNNILFTLNNKAPNSCMKEEGVSDEINAPLYASGTPHDPNSIIANKPSICPDGSVTTMIYTIVFQNIGNAPADSVTVKEILPEYFLMPVNAQSGIFKTLNPGGLTYEVDVNKREIIWKLTEKNKYLKKGTNVTNLKGTQQLSNKSLGFTEDDTKDSIVFQVTLDPNKPLPPCGAIPNRAEIYFDDLKPIITNDFIAKVLCNNCAPCNSPAYFTTLPAVTYNGTTPVTLQLPGIPQNAEVEWYPPTGLNNPHVHSPEASPATTTVYTATVRDSCSRQIFKAPVLVNTNNTGGNPQQPSTSWWWWLILLVVPFLFLLIRRRRQNDEEGAIEENVEEQ